MKVNDIKIRAAAHIWFSENWKGHFTEEPKSIHVEIDRENDIMISAVFNDNIRDNTGLGNKYKWILERISEKVSDVKKHALDEIKNTPNESGFDHDIHFATIGAMRLVGSWFEDFTTPKGGQDEGV